MDPNFWEKEAPSLRKDLDALFKDKGRVDKLICNLADNALMGRQAAWDTYGLPPFKSLASKRPGRKATCLRVSSKLQRMLFDGAAASAPDRLRILLTA